MYKRTIEKIQDSGYVKNYTTSEWLKFAAHFANSIRSHLILYENCNLDMEIGYAGYCSISALILMDRYEKLQNIRKWARNSNSIDADLCRFIELAVVLDSNNDPFRCSQKVHSALSVVHRYCKVNELDFENLMYKAMVYGGGVVYLHTL